MIKLDVQDYCHDCPYFEVEVASSSMFYANDTRMNPTDTVVRCTRGKSCKRIWTRKKEEED